MTEKETIEIKHGSENMVDLLNQEQTELKKAMIEETIIDETLTDDELCDFTQRAAVQLVPELSKKLFSVVIELCRYKTKIANETLKEIPEGAVVLTRDEWEKYQITQRDWNAIYYDGIDKARKETAMEFADKVKMAFYYEFDELIPSIMEDKIDKIAEEFGVEVE